MVDYSWSSKPAPMVEKFILDSSFETKRHFESGSKLSVSPATYMHVQITGTNPIKALLVSIYEILACPSLNTAKSSIGYCDGGVSLSLITL